jgi:hypothetical protein
VASDGNSARLTVNINATQVSMDGLLSPVRSKSGAAA